MSWPCVLCLTVAVALPAGEKQLSEVLGGKKEADTTAQVVAEVPDAKIEERLEGIYAEVDELAGVQVDARSGVVTLAGEVASEAQRDKAVRLAKSAQGVAEVVDEMEIPTGVRERLDPALEGLAEKAQAFVARLPLLGVAALIFGTFALLARIVVRSERLFTRLVKNPFLRALGRQFVGVSLVIAGAVLALELLDATAFVGAILGAAGIVALAIGFAFKDTVENYIASVLMSLRQPFDPNDLVLIGEHEGRVVRLTSRATILMTLAGNHVRIPNADVFKSTMVNYSRNPRRRFEFDIGVGVSDDLVEAGKLAVDTLLRMEGVMSDPEPEVQVIEIGESSVKVRVFGWLDQGSYDYFRVRSEALRLVKTAFDDAGVSIPEPTYNLRLWNEERSYGATQPGRPITGIEVSRDIRPDRSIDRQMAEERAAQPDLLDPKAPKE